MKKIYYSLFVLGLIACAPEEERGGFIPPVNTNDKVAAQKPGEVLAPCKEGEMDIHFINTGRGESTFYVLPDGTTMLVDMGGSLLIDDGGEPATPSRPSDSVSNETVIINYINHFISQKSKGHLDYGLITHFHGDHMGNYRTTGETPLHTEGEFALIAVNKIGVTLPYGTLLDRNYPDYNYPQASLLNNNMMKHYRKFAEWSVSKHGTVRECFDAGARNQIELVYDKTSYPDFSIQNLTASGRFWTGVGENSEMKMPESFDTAKTDDDEPKENELSCAFMLQYGKFDFYAGGDQEFGGRTAHPYKDSEAHMIPQLWRVDVAKGNHHGTKNTNDAPFMSALRPFAWITHVWRRPQPNPVTIDNVLSSNLTCDIYLTNLMEWNEAQMSVTQMRSILSKSGHIVVRVVNGGDNYIIYTLDDGDMEYKIKTYKIYTSQ